MKDNRTELSFQMNTHEFWFMKWGLEDYIECIKNGRDTPDYKLCMIHTALRTCDKLKGWLMELDWAVAKVSLKEIKGFEVDLRKERKKQEKEEEKLYGKVTTIKHARRKNMAKV